MKRFYRIRTERLTIRKVRPIMEDCRFISMLWKNPEVMKFVGFPKGIDEAPENIMKRTRERIKKSGDIHLLIELEGTPIGEAMIGFPDKDGIAHTDVKLVPEKWEKGFGKEVKRALLKWIFTHTDAKGVSATPNVKNIASIEMQESVGGKRVKKLHYKFPPNMRLFTVPVDSYLYIVYREDWKNQD